jgi:hypothetical protein
VTISRLEFKGGPLDGLQVEDAPDYELTVGRVFALPVQPGNLVAFYRLEGFHQRISDLQFDRYDPNEEVISHVSRFALLLYTHTTTLARASDDEE